jgi:Ca-activated chloride channel homolog
MSSELNVECRLARNYALENLSDALSYLLIKVTPDSTTQFGTLPLNVGLVIDVSRSMKGEKIKFACESAKILVESLNKDDNISVVIFSDDARAVVPCTTAADKSRICAAIDGIRVVNGTRMHKGMETAVRELRSCTLAKKIDRMILLTDGETEYEDRCRTVASGESGSHLVISTLGIGETYNENLLTQISDATLGRFYHLSNPGNIGDVLQREFADAAVSVISDVRLGLLPSSGVKLECMDRIFPGVAGLEPRQAEGEENFIVSLGTLKANEPTILGAQLKLPAAPAGRMKIASISFNYSIPGLDIEDRVSNQDVFIEFTGDQSLCVHVDREVVSYFNQINTQKLVEEAITATKAGDTTGATRALSEAQIMTQRLGNTQLTKSIGEAKEEITRKGTLSEESIKTVKATSRYTVRLDETNTRGKT